MYSIGLKKKQIAMISISTTLFLIGAYWVTKWSYHYSSTTQFCISCHEMIQPYQQYKKSSHYKNKSGVVAECADCHLPPGAVSKWYTKITQGMNDSVRHVFLKPEDIDHEAWKCKAVKNISSESCMKCHKNLLPAELPRGGFLGHRAFLNGEAESCLDCHKNLVHTNHE
ncbi:MAG: cytochrome C [Planctomycetes bacterium]|nr:cytochrome C [Planctomycetota bacterium]